MWAGIDHNRGYDLNESPCGMLDLLRLPKYTYEVYACQQDPHQTEPRVFIANQWTANSPRDIVVYTNCDAVRLSVNGREAATLTVKEGWANTRVYAGASYSWRFGSEVSNQSIPEGVHPPLTFKGIPFEAGELTAEAILDGHPAAVFSVRTSGVPVKLSLKPHWSGVSEWIADGSDLLMAHVYAQDANGTVVCTDEREISFTIDGCASIVGDGDVWAGTNPVHLEAGASGVLLRAGVTPGKVTLKAEAIGLESAEITLNTVPNPIALLQGPAEKAPALKPVYSADRKERFSVINQMRVESWYKLDLGKGQPVTASSYQEGYPPENAARGIAAEPWIASSANLPQWWQCDFGTPAWFFGATVYWQHDGLWYDFDISISDDGESWRIAASSRASGQSYVPVHLEEPALTRFARITARGVSGGQVPIGINMVELHGRKPVSA